MSLRDSYTSGSTGLNSQMDAAFNAGIAYVGAGTPDISTLNLGDRNGSNLSAGSGQPGLYFSYSSPTGTYAMWMSENGEIPPSVPGASLIQVNILSGDSGTSVAAKIASAMNAIPSGPFNVNSIASVIQMENNVDGVVRLAVSAGTLGGTSSVAQTQAGIAATGNYQILSNALIQAAAQGQLVFLVNVLGSGTVNASYLRGNNGNNLLLKSFFAGIHQAMSAQGIYPYQLKLQLDVSDNANTNVNFCFNFGSDHKHNSCGCEQSLVSAIPTSSPRPACY